MAVDKSHTGYSRVGTRLFNLKPTVKILQNCHVEWLVGLKKLRLNELEDGVDCILAQPQAPALQHWNKNWAVTGRNVFSVFFIVEAEE